MRSRFFSFLFLIAAAPHIAHSSMVDGFYFDQQEDRIIVRLGKQPIATYVFEDALIPRPYFCHVHSANGTQMTRNHPPVEGHDAMDHSDMHPGIWMSFGDLSGNDFWRKKARTKHARFLQNAEDMSDGFDAVNEYIAEDGKTVIAEETRAIHFIYDMSGFTGGTSMGYWIYWESVFTPTNDPIVFGDQEEMGLGFRFVTEMIETNGGELINGDGLKSAAKIWGKASPWCAYQGRINGNTAGMMMVPAPDNFRPSWYHARNYGLLAANPFGRNAMTGGEKSQVVVAKDTPLRLRFLIGVYEIADMKEGALDELYQKALGVFSQFE